MLPISTGLRFVLAGVHIIRILTVGMKATKYVMGREADMTRGSIDVSFISAFWIHE